MFLTLKKRIFNSYLIENDIFFQRNFYNILNIHAKTHPKV